MKPLFEHIIFDQAVLTDIEGVYDIKLHNMKVEWEGVEYKYESSGLCRCVYVSPDRTFVLKIPIPQIGEKDYIPHDEVVDMWKYLDVSAQHNVLEAIAYEQCPDDLKPWFAKTELLPMGWIKQEYVDVYPFSYSHNMREIGIRPSDNQACLFDYDIIIDREMYGINPEINPYDVVFERRLYERAIKIMEKYG
jgi:hypothetical protein